MKIVQISDLHAINKINNSEANRIVEKMTDVIKGKFESNEKIMVIICGDLFDKGSLTKNDEARLKEFFLRVDKLKEKFEVEYLFVPGNHDIESGKVDYLKEFDKMINQITRDSKMSYNTNDVLSYVFDNANFILLNSVCHGGYAHGKVNVEKLNGILNQSTSEKKVLILHHHLIPVSDKGLSMVSNSYELLLLCDKYKVDLILHGHQHMNLEINIGETRTKICGVGSLFCDVGTNYNNQFKLINLDDNKIELYKYHKDVVDVGTGTLGSFVREEI